MELKIRIDKPDFDKHPEKSTTQNWNRKRCVIVEFPNCDFKWIPTYKQLAQIYVALSLAEQINKRMVVEDAKLRKNN